MDGNGVVDILLVIGEPLQNSIIRPGSVYVLLMKAAGAQICIKQKIASNTGGLGPLPVGAYFGRSTTALGDLDGDGTPDLAVGAVGTLPLDNKRGTGAGAVYILLLLKKNGRVKGSNMISQSEGGLVGPLEAGDQFGWDMTVLTRQRVGGRGETSSSTTSSTSGGDSSEEYP